jgi:SsrA-binding protein
MAAPKSSKKARRRAHEPAIENRKARHDYFIEDTLEVGIKLLGTEVKSARNGQVSLSEGYVRATSEPVALELHGVHIAEYPPAGEARQHAPTRVRVLLAHRREIIKLAETVRARGATIVPLSLFWSDGKAKLVIGIAFGKKKADKRQAIAERDAKRDMDRAMSRKR